MGSTCLIAAAMVAALLGCSVVPVAAQCEWQTFYADSGSFEATGTRVLYPFEQSPWVPGLRIGKSDSATNRAYLVVHMPRFVGSFESASLLLYDGWLQGSQSTEMLRVREVLTPAASIYGYVTNGAAIYNDLGDGPIFGSQQLTNPGSTFSTEVVLNASGLAALGNSSGGDFVLGLELAEAETSDAPRCARFSSGSTWPRLFVRFNSANGPLILDSSQEVVSAFTNAPAQLWVSVCGGSNLTFQWYREGAQIPGGTKASLAVTNDSPGRYWAVVSNSIGSVTSAVTRVIINESAPVFWQQPPPFCRLVAGRAIQLGAGVSGTEPLVFQWFFNGAPLAGQTSTSLVINDCRVEHSGFYWLTASNHAGSASSYGAQVEVTPLDVSIYGNPPYAGAVYYLTARAETVAPDVSYQWRRNSLNLPGANSATLTFPNLSAADDGDYQVVAENVYGSRTSAVYRLTAYATPPYIVGVSGPSNTAAGCQLTISAALLGAQPMSLQWLFEGSPLPGETNDSLIIPSAQPEHSGTYTLVASNAYGASVSDSIRTTVSAQAPGSFDLSVAGGWLGKPCLIQAWGNGTTLGVPGSPAALAWWHDGVKLEGQTNYFFFSTNLSAADAGTYTLSASNEFGAATSSCLVAVSPRRALEQWSWKAPLPQGNDLHNLAFGNGRYMAIGDEGRVVCSSNAIDWVQASFSTSASSVRFQNGEFLLLPHQYWPLWPTAAWVSPDGRDWKVREVTAQEIALANSVFGNGIYSMGMRSSADGVHWRPGAPAQFNRIAFGNGRFVGLDSSYYWGAAPGFWTSTDGITWFQNVIMFQPPLSALAFGHGVFVAAGEDGFVFTSADGSNWTARGRVVSRDIKDVLFDGRQFVACGNRGLLLTSTDGVGWTVRGGEREDLFGVVFAQGKFVAVGDQGNIFSSPDGISWTAQYSGTSRDLHGITYANGLFVAVGRKGTVLTSPDGLVWTSRATGTASYLERVCYGEGKFIAVGNTPPTILTSANALTWQIANLSGLNLPADVRLEGAACGNGLLVAVGGHFLDPVNEFHAIPDLLVSSNGLVWERRQAPQEGNDGRILRNVTFAAGKFVVVGNDGLVSWSTNASTWSPGLSLGQNLRAVKFSIAADRFVAVGNSGTVISARNSADLSWNRHSSEIAQNLHDLAFGYNRFIGVGNGGMIVQSGPATPLFVSAGSPLPRFTVYGGIEPQYTIETSTNLDSWTASGVFTNIGAPLILEDSAPATQGFYRAISR